MATKRGKTMAAKIAADTRYDKSKGIKPGSARDNRLDRARGIPLKKDKK